MVFAMLLLFPKIVTVTVCFVCLQFQATVEEGAVGVIVNLTVEDKDDPTTGAWRAAYTIIQREPGAEPRSTPTRRPTRGMLSVVKVEVPQCSSFLA